MSKPLIALNCDVDTTGTGKVMVGRNYVQSMIKAGAIPLPIPPMGERELKQMADMAGGFLFIGGHDYAPGLYGERKHRSVQLLHPLRQEFDLQLMKLALKSRDKRGRPKPILGICGGCQLLDIVLGGTLIQDIESERPGLGNLHKNPKALKDPRLASRHAVKLVADSQLARIFGAGTIENIISSHHQAVRRLGKGLTITGFSEDGIVEAIEHTSREFTIGVQWHPEADYQSAERLFKAFVRRARQMEV